MKDNAAIAAPNTGPSPSFSLTGPAARMDARHLPARGDLADIALAGQVFVSHYVVPLPRTLATPAALKAAPREDAESLAPVAAGASFRLLDISGGWAWGQLAKDGLVGYLPTHLLEA